MFDIMREISYKQVGSDQMTFQNMDNVDHRCKPAAVLHRIPHPRNHGDHHTPQLNTSKSRGQVYNNTFLSEYQKYINLIPPYNPFEQSETSICRRSPRINTTIPHHPFRRR